ncbi:flagellin [Yersinia aleksiciae]|uniref:flagellin N-terminal helical domain-containing protein n=1 Tax=Yersinia aleksiciae TaxID=263819 RepID=UPI0025AB06A1|nr:flagellin [Yersinia aleksiciae]MDN0122254.1 flagellin [Yersinia aleksiciae]
MRISSANLSKIMMESISQRTFDYVKLDQQLKTGKRINQISDDPVASMQLAHLENSKKSVEQYQTNISRLSGNLTAQEANLTSLDNQLLSIHNKLLTAKNSNHSATQSAILGREVDMLIEGVITDLNSQNSEGNYLFSGTKSNVKPIVYDQVQNIYIYQGNSDSRETIVSDGVTMTENTHLSSVFSTSNNNLEILSDLKKLVDKMVDPNIMPSSYSQDISDMLAATDVAAGKVGGMITELGARQNRLDHLKNIHDDIQIVNANLEKDLSGVDIFKVNAELQDNMLSTKISHSIYSKISQLSLFNYL